MNRRAGQVRRVLTEKRLEALIITTAQGENKNVRYLSGFSGSMGVVVVGAKKQALVVDARYSERVRREAPGFVVVEVARAKGVYEYVQKGLESVGVSEKSRVGYEGRQVSVLAAREWKKKLRYTLVPTEGVIERLRQYKSDDEIALLCHAARATSEAYRAVAPMIVAGMHEREVAARIDAALRAQGAAGNSFPTIVASGPNAAIPHHEPGERRLRAGEPVILDFGGVFKGGYVSDLSRTIFVPGKAPSEELVRAYHAVRGAQRAAGRALKPGMTFKEYDAVARAYLEKEGLGKYFIHSVGHSLGLEAHDPFDYKGSTIEVGTVLTNEPGVYIPGKGGIRIEDDLVVTSTGAKYLTHAPYLLQ